MIPETKLEEMYQESRDILRTQRKNIFDQFYNGGCTYERYVSTLGQISQLEKELRDDMGKGRIPVVRDTNSFFRALDLARVPELYPLIAEVDINFAEKPKKPARYQNISNLRPKEMVAAVA